MRASFFKVFVNTPELDFGGAASLRPAQEFELAPNVAGEGFINTNVGRFSQATTVAFYFT